MIVFQLIVPLALLDRILESTSEGAHDMETVFVISNKAAWKKKMLRTSFQKSIVLTLTRNRLSCPEQNCP